MIPGTDDRQQQQERDGKLLSTSLPLWSTVSRLARGEREEIFHFSPFPPVGLKGGWWRKGLGTFGIGQTIREIKLNREIRLVLCIRTLSAGWRKRFFLLSPVLKGFKTRHKDEMVRLKSIKAQVSSDTVVWKSGDGVVLLKCRPYHLTEVQN
ncbi:hypothetical protein TNCV_730741 [Trichonephila clavipes]|nr:hypothetical protein TNCV_730741 [Trichonephila clavipes]